MDNKLLFIKSIFATLSDEEQRSLDKWISESGNRTTIERIRLFLTEKVSPVEFMSNINVEQGLKRVYAKAGRRKARTYRLVIGSVASVAAAVLIAFLIIPKSGDVSKTNTPQNGQFVCLQTANGETINITNDSLNLGTATLDSLLNGGKQQADGEQEVKTQQVKLTVPRGKTLALTLEDGTRVKLNALSSLAFASPITSGKERNVSLTGEAFFNVSKDKAHPFIVHTDRHNVVVTGTAFNVKAYEAESFTTTLCEGSVKVTSKNHAEVHLKPGQQLTSTPDGTVTVEYVDTGYYTAWTSGVYNFDGQSLEEVMKTLQRWYDFDAVEYRGNSLQSRRFSGRLRKKDGLQSILKVIEAGTRAEISQKGKTIIVKP